MPNELVNFTAVEWSDAAQKLVLGEDAEKNRHLEKLLGCTQAEAVSHFIEHSCCSEDLPDFAGGCGTPQERRNALLALWKDYAGAKRQA